MSQLEAAKVNVEDLQPGMFDAGLDRPWLETPFVTQGFVVKGIREIEQIRQYCRFVIIDKKRGIDEKRDGGQEQKFSTVQPVSAANDQQEQAQSRLSQEEEESTIPLPQQTPEIDSFKADYDEITDEFQVILERIKRGSALRIDNLTELANPLVESVVSNPGAITWLAQFKSADRYLYHHSLSVATWCVVIGRQLDLPKKELELLALGGMLLDIGKLKIPQPILGKEGELTDREFALVRKHVDLSVMMLRMSGERIPMSVLDMIRSHHERWDGTGYPKQLTGREIPIYSRIAAIADCYDAITRRRTYAKPVPHMTAIKSMYKWRGSAFQPELVEAFVKAVGVYPVGTIVELTSGEVAVVIRENPGKRLRPKLLVLLDKDKKLLSLFRELDLASDKSTDIYYALEPGTYGLNLEDFDLTEFIN